jgi:hypothetical protein
MAWSVAKTRSMPELIQVSGRPGVDSAHKATISPNARSAVTRKRSDAIVFRSERDSRNPSSGRIARRRGSTQ